MSAYGTGGAVVATEQELTGQEGREGSDADHVGLDEVKSGI